MEEVKRNSCAMKFLIFCSFCTAEFSVNSGTPNEEPRQAGTDLDLPAAQTSTAFIIQPDLEML